MENRYCPSCGSTLPEGAAFCGNCGSKIAPEPPANEAPESTVSGPDISQEATSATAQPTPPMGAEAPSAAPTQPAEAP